MRHQKLTLEIEIECCLPGFPVFHVEHYGDWWDLWLAFDHRGRLRPLLPTSGLDVHTLARWHGDWPPLSEIVARAAPGFAAS